MKKFRARKNSSILNLSVSTYEKSKIRNIADDLLWFDVQECKPGKGLFSDSDDSVLIPQSSKLAANGQNHHLPSKSTKAQKRRRIKKNKLRVAKEKAGKSETKENLRPEIIIISDEDSESFPKKKSNPKYKKEEENHDNIQISQKCLTPELLPELKSKNSLMVPRRLSSFAPKQTSTSSGYISPDNLEPCFVHITRLEYDLSKVSHKISTSNSLDIEVPVQHNPLNSLSNYEEFKYEIKPCSVDLGRDKVPLQYTSSSSDKKEQHNTKFKTEEANEEDINNCSSASKCKRSALQKRPKLRRSLSFLSLSEKESSNDYISCAGSEFDNSASLFKSSCQASLVALHSSKRGCITNYRRHRRCDFKITDGISVFSFSEHVKEAQESMHIFQHSVITGHQESNLSNAFLHSFDNQQNLSASKKCLIQSTPYVKNNTTPFAAKLTPFQVPKITLSASTSGYPMSSTPSLRSFQSCFGNSSINVSFSRPNQSDLGCSFEGFSSRHKIDDLSYVNKVLSECNQVSPESFDKLNYNEVACEKLGEGVSGEVFKCSSDKKATIAVKIVPINGKDKINNESQKTFSEILPEIVNSSELSSLSEGSWNRTDAFIHMFGVHCVTGKYPAFLLKSWDDYRNNRGTENERPDFFPSTQHYIVFEFADGGTDLEHFNFRNAAQALSVLQQTIAGLAVAEEVYQFEHRDLHWGNILVQPSNGKKNVEFTLGGITKQIKCGDVIVRIIDFTLSRMTKGEISLYHDLSTDADLFTGDASIDYQFEVYRMMRRETNDIWSRYKPKTNVFWIHYLLHKFLNNVEYRLKTSKLHLNSIKTLSSFVETVLDFSSCTDIVLKSSLFCT